MTSVRLDVFICHIFMASGLSYILYEYLDRKMVFGYWNMIQTFLVVLKQITFLGEL